ncbi:Crp/Fnr family transcriptional regulator [Gemmatimonadota bacterium]
MPMRVVPRRDRTLYRFIKRSETLPLRKGEVLYREGDSPVSLYLVREGHLRLTEGREGSKGRTVGLAGPWELAGGEALIPWATRRTGARAGEKAQVTVLDGRAVNRVLKGSTKTLEAYLQAMEEELGQNRTLARLSRPGGVPGRLATILLGLSSRLGIEEEGKKGVLIPHPITHGVLAELSRCHRSTVTTLMNEWIYDGLLADADRGIRILRPGALQKAVKGP